ncbi:hypothetical protein TorRG33x02_202530 [Trema orientale]|uniref:Uncharacterized protein n=1 Tax=Trema orientale TaxID=63057 RepID=A0A2P5EEI3_TREOI|nr:hypothetical protein TorRG33x02_202530 [Trema orientale]
MAIIQWRLIIKWPKDNRRDGTDGPYWTDLDDVSKGGVAAGQAKMRYLLFQQVESSFKFFQEGGGLDGKGKGKGDASRE